ncbi:MAG: hypothetical protein J6W05_04950 [Prevotella sp.]|nr:hypothetical protein [Prevotella sp.]
MRQSLHLIILLCAVWIVVACGSDKGERLQQLEMLEQMNRADSPMTDDSLALVLADFFDHHGTNNERLRAYYILGRTYADQGEASKALEAYHAAVACDTTSEDCDYHTLCLAHIQMAEIFHRHYQPRTAIAELSTAQRMAYKDKDTLLATECYFDQSNEYERLGKKDSAFAIATESARRFTMMGQHDRAAAAKSSNTLILLDQHRTDEAKAAIEAYLASAYTDSLGNVSPGREIFYYKRGLYYLQANKTDSAEYFFRKELRDGHDINNQIAGRKGLQLLYEKLGKADSVAKYAAEGYAMSDSVYMVSESQNLQSLQAMFDYTHKQLMVEQKTSELRNTRLYLAIVVISLLLVIFMVLYIIQRQNKIHAAATANYQSIIKELSIEDRLGCSPVTTHLQELANSNPPGVADPADIELLKTLISDNIPTFYDTVNPPQQMLSEQEYVVCLLTRLEFPSVNIDRLTGVSEGYTSKMKSRLYKKLTGKDGSPKDFEHWIMAIK